jgi:hypothetical protein
MMGSPRLLLPWWGFVVCKQKQSACPTFFEHGRVVSTSHDLPILIGWRTIIGEMMTSCWAGWIRISCALAAGYYSAWCLEKKQECIEKFLTTTAALYRLLGLNVYVHLVSSLKIQIQSIDCGSL